MQIGEDWSYHNELDDEWQLDAKIWSFCQRYIPKNFLEVFTLISVKVAQAVLMCMAARTDCETLRGI